MLFLSGCVIFTIGSIVMTLFMDRTTTKVVSNAERWSALAVWVGAFLMAVGVVQAIFDFVIGLFK